MNLIKSLYETNKDTEQINLEFQAISDLSVIYPWLQKFTHLRRLSLHGNRLRQLPRNLSGLGQVEELDISNNLFQNIDLILEPLQSLPQLKILYCNIKSKEQQQKISKRLKRLTHLNRHKISREIEEVFRKSEVKEINIKQEHLESMAECYDHIRQVYKQHELNKDLELAQQFDRSVDTIMKNLKNNLKMEQSPQHIVETRILCTRYALVDLCFNKFIKFFEMVDPQLSQIAEQIHDTQALIFKELVEIIFKKNPERSVVNPVQAKNIKFNKQFHRIKKHRDDLIEDVEELQKENVKLHEKLFNLSRNGMPFSKSLKQIRTPSKSIEKPEFEKPVSETLKHAKPISSKQLKELIEEMFLSKQKYDIKCKQLSRPKQTLEQYMYTFLNKKYGLKSLTVEWAITIVNGIKLYGQDENCILVFGKILRNEIQEKFQRDQKDLRKLVEELLKTSIRSKTNKLNHQVQMLFLEKLHSHVNENQCEEIVNYLYKKQVAQSIMQIVNQIIQQSEKLKNLSRSSSRKEIAIKSKNIKYSDFLEIILDWNMKLHEKQLETFVDAFRKYDHDSDGILNELEFRNLYFDIANKNQQSHYEDILYLLDPHSTNILTFSDICQALQVHPKDMPILKKQPH